MDHRDKAIGFRDPFLFGFISGFFATLIFHQLGLAVLWGLGLAPFPPYSMALTHSLRYTGSLLAVVLGRCVGYSIRIDPSRLST